MAKSIAVLVTEEEHEKLKKLAGNRGFQSVKEYMKATALKPPRDSLEKLHNPFFKAG